MDRPAEFDVRAAAAARASRRETRVPRDCAATATAVFDCCRDLIAHGHVEAGMTLLHRSLHDRHERLDQPRWRALVHTVFRPHPLAALVREDPLTRRSYDKPRGRAGDAVLLDMIYTGRCPEATPVGRAIFACTSQSPVCRTVRRRRHVMSRAIDHAADVVPSPTVVAVACGHVREAADAAAVRAGHVGRFVALDMDGESPMVVRRDYPSVELLHGSVRDALRGRVRLPAADLIYSTGLYDDLSAAEARLLTQRLVGSLNPGGRLLIANLMPALFDIGYMEACMDWWLTYRTARQVMDLCSSAAADMIGSAQVYTAVENTVAFLDIERR